MKSCSYIYIKIDHTVYMLGYGHISAGDACVTANSTLTIPSLWEDNAQKKQSCPLQIKLYFVGIFKYIEGKSIIYVDKSNAKIYVPLNILSSSIPLLSFL